MRVAAFGGILSALLMAIASLAPWVVTPVGTLSGVTGIGWLLVALAVAGALLHVAVLAGAIRWAAMWGVAIGMLAGATWIVLNLGIALASRSTHFLALLIERRWASEYLVSEMQIEAAWGLHLLAVSALGMIGCSIGAAAFAGARPGPAGGVTSSFGIPIGSAGATPATGAPSVATAERGADDLL